MGKVDGSADRPDPRIAMRLTMPFTYPATQQTDHGIQRRWCIGHATRDIRHYHKDAGPVLKRPFTELNDGEIVKTEAFEFEGRIWRWDHGLLPDAFSEGKGWPAEVHIKSPTLGEKTQAAIFPGRVGTPASSNRHRPPASHETAAVPEGSLADIVSDEKGLYEARALAIMGNLMVAGKGVLDCGAVPIEINFAKRDSSGKMNRSPDKVHMFVDPEFGWRRLQAKGYGDLSPLAPTYDPDVFVDDRLDPLAIGGVLLVRHVVRQITLAYSNASTTSSSRSLLAEGNALSIGFDHFGHEPPSIQETAAFASKSVDFLKDRFDICARQIIDSQRGKMIVELLSDFALRVDALPEAGPPEVETDSDDTLVYGL
jgi:hypothetical protein